MPFNDSTLPSKGEILSQLHPTPCNVVRTLVSAGYEAYIVGGAIRDLLTGNVPKDYDICTSATPEQVRAVFGRRRCHVIGRRFRLAHVYSGGDLYEVSTFRRVPDENERKGRKDDGGPLIWNDNCYGTLEEDAQRRDFTCNALYFDVTGNRGIIDFSGGIRDIRDGIVRCIGNPSERLSEDPVRMLRALKLVGQFGLRLESGLEETIRRQAEMIKLASSSRLFEELLKILNHPNAWKTLTVLHDTGFLKHFWPTVDASWEDQEGEMLCNMLKLRGDAIRRGHYSNSRGLALTTVSMPFLMSALNPEHPLEFWERPIIGNEMAHKALKLIFDGFMLPRIFEDRILIIAGMVPRLRTPPAPPRILNNAEYRYARAVVALLAQLPEFSPRYELGDVEIDTPEENAPSTDEGESSTENVQPEETGAETAGAEKPARRRRPRRSRRRGNKADNRAAETAAGETPPAEAAEETSTSVVDEATNAETPVNKQTPAGEQPPAVTAAPAANPTILPLTSKKAAAPRTPRRKAAFEEPDADAPKSSSRRRGDGESITFG